MNRKVECSMQAVARATLILTILMIMNQVTDAKAVEGTITFEEFRKHECKFVTKYGAIGGKFLLDMKYYLNGNFAQARYAEMSDADTHELALIAVNRQTHLRITDLIRKNVLDIWSSIKDDLEKEIKLDIMNDGSLFHRYTHESSDIHYYYFCDHSSKLRQFESKKQEEAAEKQREADQKLKEGLDVTTMFNKVLDWFGHSSTFRYDLKLMTDSEHEQFSHHSVEQNGTNWLLSIFSTLFLALFIYLIRRLVSLYKANEHLDHPLLIISITLGLHLVGMIINFVHFSIYSSTGNDFQFLNVFARLWYLAADALISMLLIMMSKGWGIANVSLFDENEIEFVIAILLLTLRYLWVVLGFFADVESEEIFHVFDGITGKLELLNTLVLFGWFMYSITTSDLFKAYKYQKWKQQLTLYSTLLLFIKPAFILLIYLTSQHNQHFYSHLASHLSYFAVCLLITYKMTDLRAPYLKVAVSNASELKSHKPE